MNISIVVIGRNTQKTLRSSILSISDSVENTNQTVKYEIIYIDSKSNDNSVQIAKELGVKVVEIIDGYTTASLGRYLGKEYSKYENLVFIDSDMYLDIEWFNNSLEYYEMYGAIIGERYEKLYKNNVVVKEIPKFYNINNVEIASNIGGFLMIKKDFIEDMNYTPIIKNEEEKDFYAKFYDKAKIYRIPVTAYIHNNYNLSTSRIKDYLNPYAKNGYILSLYNSIKNKYFKNYILLQRKYIISVFSSILFYISLFVGCYIGLLISLFLLFINGRKQIKGSLMTMLFFPYKLTMSLVFLTKKQKSKYKYLNKEYEMDVKI